MNQIIKGIIKFVWQDIYHGQMSVLEMGQTFALLPVNWILVKFSVTLKSFPTTWDCNIFFLK